MKSLIKLMLVSVIAVAFAGSGTELFAGPVVRDMPQDKAAADALFTNVVVLRLRLEIPESGMKSLRQNPRRYVRATLHEGDTVYTDVGIHLKGSAGSFRGVDDKPGLTLNCSTFEASSKFHGLKKFHLNNSVQDPTYLSELVCGDLFRAAGVPATRVAHALVELNGHKLGLYVLKESFNKDFLAQYFRRTRGNMYGQPGGGDITEPLERVEGHGENTRTDLKALADAAREPEPTKRWERLQQVLDVDRFLSYMSLEVLLCHWDGYTFARHNYRVYHDLDTDKMVFFPHDMDQMIRNANVPIFPGAGGLISRNILETPEARWLYRERIEMLFTNLFVVPTLTNRIHELVARLEPVLKDYDPNLARNVANQANDLVHRIMNRAASLKRQFEVPAPRRLTFVDGVATVKGWRKQDWNNSAHQEQISTPDGKTAYWINTSQHTTASWRAKILLPAGRYRFEGLARSAGIDPTHDPLKGTGAGLRISGSQQLRGNQLTGDSPWQPLAYEFVVRANLQEIELVCELRATQGEVWFDANSLQLGRQP